MTTAPKPTPATMLSESEKIEIDIHLAEYNALSEFQRDAKASFVRIATYHNTGIVVAAGWALQQIIAAEGLVKALAKSEFLLPVFLALPVLNAVMIIACGYQVYSFFCVALHFQTIRQRLSQLVGTDVLAYENKFRQLRRAKELSLVLDVFAGVAWFVIPVALAFTVAIGFPFWVSAPTPGAVITYWIGTVLSVVAAVYLAAVIALMLKTRAGPVKRRSAGREGLEKA